MTSSVRCVRECFVIAGFLGIMPFSTISTEYAARDVAAMIILPTGPISPLSAGLFGSCTFKQWRDLLGPDVIDMPKIAHQARNVKE